MYHVLYVDDESSLLEIGKLFLEESKEFVVSTSTSAKDVLNAGSLSEYDAIISDYQMPAMDGIEFLKEVRSGFGHIPFILFTGKGREEIVIEAINNGADFYLQKGGDPASQYAELMHKIRIAVLHRRAEEQIVFQNRLYSVLSATNRAIVYIRNKTELFSEICRILVEIGGFQTTWIGIADKKTSKIVPVASFGKITEYLNNIQVSIEDIPLGRGPTGRAYREGKCYYSNDIQADPDMMPWREAAEKHGYLSSAAFPFALGTQNGGVVSVYAPKTGFFDERILNLLDEMSRDISFALRTIDEEEQRKSAENALKESEEKLRAAFDNSPFPIAVSDLLNDNILFWSKSARNLFGHNVSNTRDWFEKAYPDPLYRNEVTERWKPFVETAKTSKRAVNTGEYNITCNDGSVHICEIYADVNGANLIVRFNDITERKQAEKDLRESEERLGLALNVAQMGTWDLDLTGHTAWRSLRHDQIFGYESLLPEWTYEMFLEHVVPEDQDFVNKAFNDAQLNGHDWEFECRIERTDGEIRWIWARGRIQFGPSGEQARMLGLVQDITELKQADEERQHLANIVEYSDDAIIGKTLEGIIVSWNTGAERLYGYNAAEVIGKSVAIFIPPGDKDELPDILKKIHNKEIINHFETKRVRKDGEVIDVSLTISPIKNALGIITGASTIAHDITKRKQNEEALRESDERFRYLFDSIPVGIGISNMEGKVLEINPAMQRLTGYPLLEFQATNLRNTYVNPDDRIQIIKGLQKNGEIRDYEVLLKRKDGKTYYALLNSRIISIDGEDLVLTTTIDISDRRNLEKDLIESKKVAEESLALFKTLNEHAPVGFAFMDTEYRFVQINETLAEINGLSVNEHIGRTLEEVLPEIWLQVKPIYEQVLKTSKPVINIELSGVTRALPDVTRYWICNYYPVQTNDNQIIGIGVVVIEISERKKWERKLQANEDRFRHISKTITDFAYSCRKIQDDPFTIDWLTGPIERITGYTVDEIKEMTCWRPLVIDEDIPEFDRNVIGLAPAESSHTELRIRRKDGEIIWLEIFTECVTDPINQNQSILYGGCQDITKRKLTENALIESDERYISLFSRSLDFIYIHDLDGNFIAANPAALNFFEYKTEDIKNINLLTILGPEQIKKAYEMIDKIVKNGSHDGLVEYVISKKEGTPASIETKSTLIVHDGGPYAIMGIARDITERKHAEEAIRQVNRQLKLLTAITRHDIINNVAVILGHISLAKKKFADPALEEFFSKMEQATIAIESEIEFTRAYQELGMHDPQWQDIDSLLHGLTIPINITLNTDLSGAQVFADPMFEKVFSNLLDNTIRHGGQVTEIRIYSSQNEGGIAIIWEDNGTGIPHNEKERIFERGFGKNSGLGLFLIKEILSITGLTINENGEPGKCARFEITIPKGSYRLHLI